jgi:flagellar basal-body rod protein FlgG
MDRALFAAATGMAAQQHSLDALASDLANAGVPGFKGSAETFAELVAPGDSGLGTESLGTHRIFTQGKLMKSAGPFDLAIDGPGFFAVTDAKGRHAYTRDGEFARAADGSLRNAQDWRLEGIRVPSDALSVSVAEDGTVTAAFAAGHRTIGRISVTEFAAPEHLRATGGTLFETTPQSGPPRRVAAGSDDGPKLRFGMLEQSNVSIVESMMRILSAQRAYEANAKGVQAADEMLRIEAC